MRLLKLFLRGNYNFESGAYLTSSPIITANWEARGSGQIRAQVQFMFPK